MTAQLTKSRKLRFEILMGRHVANPLVKLMDRAGIQSPLMAEIETTGRKSGVKRTVPVGMAIDAAGVWIISQHGRGSGWIWNLEADPNVRVKIGNNWRSGVATVRPDDDVTERAKTFAKGRVRQALVASTFRALQTTPVSVRVDFSD